MGNSTQPHFNNGGYSKSKERTTSGKGSSKRPETFGQIFYISVLLLVTPVKGANSRANKINQGCSNISTPTTFGRQHYPVKSQVQVPQQRQISYSPKPYPLSYHFPDATCSAIICYKKEKTLVNTDTLKIWQKNFAAGNPVINCPPFQ